MFHSMALCRAFLRYSVSNNITNLKSWSRVSQGHWKWYHSIDCAWFPISVLYWLCTKGAPFSLVTKFHGEPPQLDWTGLVLPHSWESKAKASDTFVVCMPCCSVLCSSHTCPKYRSCLRCMSFSSCALVSSSSRMDWLALWSFQLILNILLYTVISNPAILFLSLAFNIHYSHL